MSWRSKNTFETCPSNALAKLSNVSKGRLSPEPRIQQDKHGKLEHGEIDHNKASTGDDLRAFVTDKLFPYLYAPPARIKKPSKVLLRAGLP